MAEEELLENDGAPCEAREEADDVRPCEDAARDDASGAEDAEGSDVDDADADDGYEEVELEFDEDDIEAYIVDEDDNEIGFIMLDEDGNEVEYYYTDDDDAEEEDEDNPYDLGITREGVAEATSDMNDIYRDGIVIARELKDALSDIQDALDFSDVLPKKKK